MASPWEQFSKQNFPTPKPKAGPRSTASSQGLPYKTPSTAGFTGYGSKVSKAVSRTKSSPKWTPAKVSGNIAQRAAAIRHNTAGPPKGTTTSPKTSTVSKFITPERLRGLNSSQKQWNDLHPGETSAQNRKSYAREVAPYQRLRKRKA